MIKLNPTVVAKHYALMADDLNFLATEYKTSFGIDPDKILIEVGIPRNFTKDAYSDMLALLKRTMPLPSIKQATESICLSLTSWAELQKIGIDFQIVERPNLKPSDTYPKYSELKRVSINIEDIIWSDIFRQNLVAAVQKVLAEAVDNIN